MKKNLDFLEKEKEIRDELENTKCWYSLKKQRRIKKLTSEFSKNINDLLKSYKLTFEEFLEIDRKIAEKKYYIKQYGDREHLKMLCYLKEIQKIKNSVRVAEEIRAVEETLKFERKRVMPVKVSV